MLFLGLLLLVYQPCWDPHSTLRKQLCPLLPRHLVPHSYAHPHAHACMQGVRMLPDLILLDEAQDVNPVTLQVTAARTHPPASAQEVSSSCVCSWTVAACAVAACAAGGCVRHGSGSDSATLTAPKRHRS